MYVEHNNIINPEQQRVGKNYITTSTKQELIIFQPCASRILFGRRYSR